MACCKPKSTRLVNQLSFEENELDVISRVSTVPTESVKGEDEEEDPDSLTTHQVVIAVIFIIVFAASFATSFCFFKAASDSLKSDFDSRNYTCNVSSIDSEYDVNCGGTSDVSPCINVKLRCKGINRTLVMYQYYHDYFSLNKCSATRCFDPDRIYTNKETQESHKFPISLMQRCCTEEDVNAPRKSYPADTKEEELFDDYTFKTGDAFQYDRNKPDAIFYMRSEPGSTRLALSHPVSYIILTLPQIIMVLILLAIMVLFFNNKLIAKEIYRPVTTITPMHTQVNGKWYIKEVKQDVQMNAFEKLRAAQNNS